MQALHYLREAGDAHQHNGKLNLALKKYYAIQKVRKSLSFLCFELEFRRYLSLSVKINMTSINTLFGKLPFSPIPSK